jgi:hypothetical protein
MEGERDEIIRKGPWKAEEDSSVVKPFEDV